MTLLEQMLMNTDSAVILGHVRPDGDCVGAALGLYSYIRSFRPSGQLFTWRRHLPSFLFEGV